MICDALDSHEYWQLGDELPRNDGCVFIPGDVLGDDDRYWNGREPSADELIAIDEVKLCRAIAERLALRLRLP